ncbi:preprotein translocase subunit SecY [Christensenellaceae bacterium OttesenSCG-928-L17]|nr:preprotein translocase subunit SecY [Christensenellaceae bacterium OttesenSCG-928-L17]
MFKTLVDAFKIKDIRKKILMTLLLIMIYRLGCAVPIPGVDASFMAEASKTYGVLGYMNLLSGGGFSNFAIFAMGISPYITGSIVMQLLQIAIPSLERMAKEEDGRQKLQQITRFVGIGLALVQSIGITLSLGPDAVYNTSFFTYATIGVVATAGTAFLMWLGERITDYGIGNGISMLIFASIVSQVPRTVVLFFTNFRSGAWTWWLLPVVLLLVVGLITLVVYVNEGVRRVPVQYAKRVQGRKQYGGQSTHIPMKANANGVMPLIFAMTITQIPLMIMQLTVKDWENPGGFWIFWTRYLGTGTVAYYIIYALLIVGFAYFYTTISFNPIEMSKNLQQYGGFIPGIRPGKPTSDYLGRISSRLTLFGAIFLALIAILPTLILSLMGIDSQQIAFGPTSVLIMVSVALETMEQLQSQMLMRHYKGFLG